MGNSLVPAAGGDKIAYQMAASGITVSYQQLEDASNQGAQLFRSLGLQPGDGIAIMMENHPLFMQICWAAQRAGLYYTAISYRLQKEEVQYIVQDCSAKVFITSEAMSSLAEELLELTPDLQSRYMVGGDCPGYQSWESAIAQQSIEQIPDQVEGTDMLYSSGTTGRPKGIKIPLSGNAFLDETPGLILLLIALYQMDSEAIYLSPAPLYHAAPLRYNMAFMRTGATCIIMENFAEEAALQNIEKYKISHSQWVPTMFVRMLKLPEEVRAKYDVSSLKVAIHAAAPCPVPIKEQMIAWWGEVIYEYYAGTEGNGFVAIDSAQWLSHRGSVGLALLGKIHIVDDEGEDVAQGESGTIYFETESSFEYHNDPEKTKASRHAKGWSTLGDVGYLDEEGFLYLTDRKAYMIISGGVNIYPQEAENILITHPKVRDVAVFGVPNEEFGEEVKAVVEPADFSQAGAELEQELIAFCREHLAHLKCPRSIDFDQELPRHPTGKLYKRLLKDRYWQGEKRIAG